MITGTTDSGFTYTLDEETMDDYELLEMLCDIDNGKESLITQAAKQLLGVEQLNALKEHVRNDKGRVPATKMIAEITQILSENKEGKNS